MWRGITVLCLLAAGFVLAPGTGNAGSTETANTPPTVIELFTSQGCSSCPPADAFLYEVAGDDGIVAISWHVNYWDYIGWKDPFATGWSTSRQMAYRGKFDRKYAYTPQMVIDGGQDVVGSRRRKVKRMVAASRDEAAGRIPVALAREAATGELIVTFSARTLDRKLDVWLVGYSGVHETKVLRGENRGETLHNTHIARSLSNLGTWDGAGGAVRFPMPETEDVAGFALLLQEQGQGPIRGAAKLDLMS